MSTPTVPPTEDDLIAAIDLGSNSFHMVVARLVDRRPVIVDRVRRQVQLAAGLERGGLTEDAMARAVACLELFRQRLRGLKDEHVRAVGTNTLRATKKPRKFLERAEAALGHPIEIVSGVEEARLVYSGVAHDLDVDDGRRLVVDIGGGSTECVVGDRFEPLEAHSLYMGCVGYTRRFFEDGQIKKKRLDKAVLAAQLELQTAARPLRRLGWDQAVGSSGTMRMAAAVIRANDWSTGGIDLAGLHQLRDAVLAKRRIEDIDLPGLKPERQSVLPGGLAILLAVFESLKVKSMTVANGALREGLLYDLIGRISDEDIRERTIRTMQDRYHVDRVHAAAVQKTALELKRKVAGAWGLDPTEAHRFLSWGAQLHEIGLAVSYPHHHIHGNYLVAHSDMPGFSRNEQELLAAIVGSHRRKVRPERLDDLTDSQRKLAGKLTALLRVAVLLERGRGSEATPPINANADPHSLELGLDSSWLAANQLTAADLEAEAKAFKALGLELRA